MITLDAKTQLLIDIIAKVAAGKITIHNASKLASCSRRTIERYLKKYQTTGIKFAVHGNIGKSPTNKI